MTSTFANIASKLDPETVGNFITSLSELGQEGVKMVGTHIGEALDKRRVGKLAAGSGDDKITEIVTSTVSDRLVQIILIDFYHSSRDVQEYDNGVYYEIDGNAIYLNDEKKLIDFYLDHTTEPNSVRDRVVDYALTRYPDLFQGDRASFVQERINKLMYRMSILVLIVLFVVMVMAVIYLMGKTASRFSNTAAYPSMLSYHNN